MPGQETVRLGQEQLAAEHQRAQAQRLAAEQDKPSQSLGVANSASRAEPVIAHQKSPSQTADKVPTATQDTVQDQNTGRDTEAMGRDTERANKGREPGTRCRDMLGQVVEGPALGQEPGLDRPRSGLRGGEQGPLPQTSRGRCRTPYRVLVPLRCLQVNTLSGVFLYFFLGGGPLTPR